MAGNRSDMSRRRSRARFGTPGKVARGGKDGDRPPAPRDTY